MRSGAATDKHRCSRENKQGGTKANTELMPCVSSLWSSVQLSALWQVAVGAYRSIHKYSGTITLFF